MVEFEQNLIMLRCVIDSLAILSTSEEIADTTTGSALFGITEVMNNYLKKIENSFEEGCKNGNF